MPRVNALNGATFISTVITLMDILSDMLCQCPKWGYLHFYKTMKNNEFVKWGDCVNALNGATFISTLTSGNPHK